MNTLPSLDAHAHIHLRCTCDELLETGTVLAMTLLPAEGSSAIRRREAHILWGVGCHPRNVTAQATFQAGQFRSLVEQTTLVGEVGLDTSSRVPVEKQLKTFRQVLEIVAELPRIVSIHSYRATDLVLKEIRQHPVAVPILHWWTGTAAETSEAVELGCYFSIHSAVARQSKVRTWVPANRILVESDHGYNDPPAAIPLRVGWVEHLVAQQYGMDVTDVRRLVWQNFGGIVQKTGTQELLPELFLSILSSLG